MIGGDAVGQRVRAAGIFRYVAADGAGFLAGRIGREMQAGVRDGDAEVGIHHAGLHRGALVLDVNFQDAIHARKNYENAALARERSAGKAGAGAAADDRRLVLVGEFDDGDDVFGVAREDHAIGARDFDRAVVFVEQQLLGPMQHGVGAEGSFQFVEKSRVHLRVWSGGVA